MVGSSRSRSTAVLLLAAAGGRAGAGALPRARHARAVERRPAAAVDPRRRGDRLRAQPRGRHLRGHAGGIEEIEPGDFVGLTSVSAGGRRVALEAHLFSEDLRGLGEGHYAWDLVEEPNMMTNATIAEVKDAGGDRQLEVTYRTGEGKPAGSQSIYLPTGVPIVKMARSDDRTLLQPGRGVMLIVQPERDATPQVVAAVVGDGTIDPPM